MTNTVIGYQSSGCTEEDNRVMTVDDEYLYSFGTWVRRRRKTLDLTQATLAQRVGCAEVTIRKLEADAFRPSREFADRLALCLDIPIDQRDLFVQVARAERSVDQLATPLASSAPAAPALTLPEPVGVPEPDEEAVARHVSVLDRNCQALLTKVKTIWISGVLNHSLYQQVLIKLALVGCSSAVRRPHDLLVQRPEAPELPVPAGTPISEVFDQASGELLILGEPGAGKTTLLLELLQELLERAERDSTHPLPVVFPLSTWGKRELPLNEWMVDELVKRYGVPGKLARTWIEADHILPLLDGLDEVDQDHRATCVDAINDYHQQHGLQPLVVCSRISDYEQLVAKLQLHDAVRVQSLSDAQIDAYLASLGPCVAPVQAALHADPTLRSLLDTPLMLHIITLTYAGQLDDALQTLGSPEERRSQLFAAYIQRMFERGPAKQPYSMDQTMRWLKWLAWQMRQHDQTIFFLERMQPDWLPSRMRWLPTIGLALFVAFVSGIFFGLGTYFGNGVMNGLLIGISNCVLMGIHAAYAREITCVEVVQWSWKRRPDTPYSPLAGMIYGLIGGCLGGQVSGWQVGVVVGLGICLLYWLIDRLTHSEIETKTVPNQGIRRSARNGIIFGLIGGLVIGLAGGSGTLMAVVNRDTETSKVAAAAGMVTLKAAVAAGIVTSKAAAANDMVTAKAAVAVVMVTAKVAAAANGMVTSKEAAANGANTQRSGLEEVLQSYIFTALAGGLFFGLMNGGRACLQHFVLRGLLVRNEAAPWRYVAFLDFAAQRILLRKVGGGYMFIHRLLRDYLAEEYVQDLEQAARRMQSPQPAHRRLGRRVIPTVPVCPLPASLRKRLVSFE